MFTRKEMLMRLIKRLFFGAVALSFAITVTANDVNTSGQSGVIRTFSANMLGKTGFYIGSSFKYSADKDYVSVVSKRGAAISHDASHLFSGNFYIGYGLFKYLDFSFDIPAYYDVSGFDLTSSGIGDLGIALKLGNPFQKDSAFISHAYALKLTFPTGQNKRGLFARHSYYVTDDQRSNINKIAGDAYFLSPMILWTMSFDRLSTPIPLRLHANLGCVVAPQKSRSAVLGALAVEYTPVPLLTLFTEITGESSVKRYTERFKVSSFNDDQVWLTPGLKFNFPNGMFLTMAGDFGISDRSDINVTNWSKSGYNYSTRALPRFGAQIAFGWQGIFKEQDMDQDGIDNKKDKCPKEPEDKDGFEDDDGCPDPDNDKDGIPDEKDKCPNEAEDKDGFEDDDGCPDLDNDKDGIPDDKDKCPDEAEDKDGFEDDDGCPDLDNDKDGILDANDLCPDKPEDLDGFEDSDGCPELDNDGDGVVDSLDKCPGVKGLPTNDGCPKTQEIQRGKLILAGVTFMSGKAVLNVNSYTILDQVYESLAEWKEVKLEIQGHTDSQGSEAANLKLSQARADAVRMYLIKKGISADRLRAVGYGEAFPIADNATAEGRERNRRVELHRID
jgi:outer membrane protein OmpA-like peptidoglycan-associated protein